MDGMVADDGAALDAAIFLSVCPESFESFESFTDGPIWYVH